METRRYIYVYIYTREEGKGQEEEKRKGEKMEGEVRENDIDLAVCSEATGGRLCACALRVVSVYSVHRLSNHLFDRLHLLTL